MIRAGRALRAMSLDPAWTMGLDQESPPPTRRRRVDRPEEISPLLFGVTRSGDLVMVRASEVQVTSTRRS